jgi:hypothetical protein
VWSVECGVLQLMEWGRGGDMIENFKKIITRCNGPKQKRMCNIMARYGKACVWY